MWQINFNCVSVFVLATLNSSDVVETDTSLKLRDWDFIKNSETRNFKICGFCRNFSKKCRYHFPSWIFFKFLAFFRPVFIVSYLQIQKKKNSLN